MVNIFDEMKKVAVRMEKGDPSCAHLAKMNSSDYQPTREWIQSVLPNM